jgi:hypothetical protein
MRLATRLPHRFAPILALVLALLSPAVLRADSGTEIRAVIAAQIEAFRRDDWEGAFAFASPGIRSMFRTADRFGGMVRQGYPMVWRPARIEPGPLADGPRGPVQTMFIEDARGVLHEAEYEMQQVGGAWRINGVRIRRAEGASS